MNPVDPNDPRIQKLLAALKAQGGQPGGRPIFGGVQAHGTGGGQRGLASYFKPGFAGINYNPLSAQIGRGAQGILGLHSGGDLHPETPAAVGASATGDAPPDNYTPPVLGQQWGDTTAIGVPDPYNPSHVVLGGPNGIPYGDTNPRGANGSGYDTDYQTRNRFRAGSGNY